MIVDVPARSVKPRCHNRLTFINTSEPLHSPDRHTGFLSVAIIRNDWSSPGCKTWSGAGIGQPTERFPSGTPYPIAHGFDCRGCPHLPEEFRELA